MRIQATSIVAVLLATACAHEPKTVSPSQDANANCISGYFEGTATSESSATETLGLNLVCQGTASEGDAFTAAGRFRVLGAKWRDGQVEINIGEDRSLGALSGTFDGTRLVGRF